MTGTRLILQATKNKNLESKIIKPNQTQEKSAPIPIPTRKNSGILAAENSASFYVGSFNGYEKLRKSQEALDRANENIGGSSPSRSITVR